MIRKTLHSTWRGLTTIRYYSKSKTVEVTNGFEKSWRTMTDAEKAPIIKEYAALEAQDWHTLALEQKRNSYNPFGV